MRRFLTLLFLIAVTLDATSQQGIALGEWRTHISFNNIVDIAEGDDHVFGAAQSGIVVVDKNDRSFSTLHKLNGLTRAGITRIAYHTSSGQLLVIYSDGTFDMKKGSATRNFDPAQNTVLTGPKEIHAVKIDNNIAYLATDYGVLLFDLTQSGIKEAWRDLGDGGTTISIRDITFSPDSVYLATAEGVIAGDRDDNLLDFARWKRYDDEGITSSIDFISYFSNSVIAVRNGDGIYQQTEEGWTKLPFLENMIFSDVTVSGSILTLSEGSTIHQLYENLSVSQITDVAFSHVHKVLQSGSSLWIGDSVAGLILRQNTTVTKLLPNGPATDQSFDLAFHRGKLVSASGGFSKEGIGYQRSGVISMFENGAWNSGSYEIDDISAVSYSPDGDMFAASFGHGVLHVGRNGTSLYDESNSSLINANPPARNVNVSSLTASTAGLWVANYGASQSLHHRTTSGEWKAFAFPVVASRYPLQIVEDRFNSVWMRLNPEEGGGLLVYNKDDDEYRYLTENDGSGELPARNVYSLAVDRDGYVWAGTDQGVAYFYDRNNDAVKPIFENRFLLRDDKVTAIAVDGGNRKWMGTERGVWLFDPLGERLITNFHVNNSPLPSNHITDIEIDPATGEVFFATDMGIASFRSDATEGKARSGDIKIFPNPVMGNFSGLVSINGLATDAVVKITDVSGKLIYETRANGGTASWNVKDHSGRRVPTGVFLVFAATPDGGESSVGKIAVVN